MANYSLSLRGQKTPRVVLFAFASCFGCQLQITNKEQHLLDVFGQIQLGYWQLISGEPLPEEFDVAVIEGAVTTKEAAELVQEIRQRAQCVIGIGACALTGGIPGIGSNSVDAHASIVYGQQLPQACGDIVTPASIKKYIDIDFEAPCCPVDFYTFVDILHRALYGSNKTIQTTSMCGSCKINGTQCLYEQGQICMGLVTRAGCGARCPKLGRPCNGCAGMTPDANLESACQVVASYGQDVELFKQRLGLFNAGTLNCAEEQ